MLTRRVPDSNVIYKNLEAASKSPVTVNLSTEEPGGGAGKMSATRGSRINIMAMIKPKITVGSDQNIVLKHLKIKLKYHNIKLRLRP